MARSPSDKDPLTFEEALARLEQVVAELETADTPLEKAIALVEEGEKLYRFCHEQLGQAEGRIQKLVERLGGAIETEPLRLPNNG